MDVAEIDKGHNNIIILAYMSNVSLLGLKSSVMVSCNSVLSLVVAPIPTSPVAAISNRQRLSSPHTS